MKKEYASLVLAAMLTLGGTGLANASVEVIPTAINYTAENLPDGKLGERNGDLWKYTYTVTGNSFDMGAFGFRIIFEGDKTYLPVDDDQPSPNDDWSVRTFDGGDGDVMYDVQALVDYPSLADQFSVTFIWSGGAEGPGSQDFYVYDKDYALMGDWSMTSPVPVPGTVILLGSALAALSAVGRRKKY